MITDLVLQVVCELKLWQPCTCWLVALHIAVFLFYFCSCFCIAFMLITRGSQLWRSPKLCTKFPPLVWSEWSVWADNAGARVRVISVWRRASVRDGAASGRRPTHRRPRRRRHPRQHQGTHLREWVEPITQQTKVKLGYITVRSKA